MRFTSNVERGTEGIARSRLGLEFGSYENYCSHIIAFFGFSCKANVCLFFSIAPENVAFKVLQLFYCKEWRICSPVCDDAVKSWAATDDDFNFIIFFFFV